MKKDENNIDSVSNLLDDDKIEIFDEEDSSKDVAVTIDNNSQNNEVINKDETTSNIETLNVNNEDIAIPQPKMSSSNINANNDNVEIKETETLKGEAGTTVIGEVDGDEVLLTSKELPQSIDVSVKPPKVDVKPPKKVKVVTKREKITSIIISIIVILIIAGGAYAAYYFFYVQNNNIFEAKNVSIEAGSELPNSASFYVKTSKTIDDMEYVIDLSGVLSTIGTYNYTINHNGVIKMGTVTVNDTKGPEVTFKDNLKFNKGATITKDDLVKECTDISNCTYELTSDVDTSNSGNIETSITAKDDIGNTSIAKVTIEIVDISKVLVCTSNEEKNSDNTYTTKNVDTLSFDSANNLVSSTGKKVYTYIDYASYFDIYNAQQNNSEYNFDKKTFSYWINNAVLASDLNTKQYDEINNYYSNNNYNCE